MTWDRAITAIKDIGFPAAIAIILLLLGNKWVAAIVEELRELRLALMQSATATNAHITEQAARVIREVQHDTRSAMANVRWVKHE